MAGRGIPGMIDPQRFYQHERCRFSPRLRTYAQLYLVLRALGARRV